MRQRGIVSPELAIAGGLLVFLIVTLSAAFWYVGKERKEAFAAGEVSERTKWQARDNAAIREANAKLVASQKRVAALEHQAAEDLAKLEEEKDLEVARVQAAKDQFVSDVVAGRVRLFDPFRAAAGQRACADSNGPATAGAAQRDEEADLRRAYAERVARSIAIAAEADALITEAQGVIASDRRACNRGSA